MRPRSPLLPIGLVLALFACGGTTAATPAGDGGAPSDGSPAVPCSAGDTLSCFGGSTVDHVCGDAGTIVHCEGGELRCPAGTIPQSECWCNTLGSCGPNVPRGVCTPSGWSCEPPDAAPEATPDASPVTCHGACPQPNGSSCQSDCDCYGKCKGGTCADPPHPAVPCANDAGACVSGQTCGAASGVCEGAPCATSDECPPQQQCLSQTCQFYGCL